jgi:hypothetical protein
MILRDAGFPNVKIYWPFPSYAVPLYILDASDSKTIEYLIEQYSGNRFLSLVTRYLAKTGGLKYFFETYSLVAR